MNHTTTGVRHVHQKHAHGCAIAGLAMLSGRGYDRIFKMIDCRTRKEKNSKKSYNNTSLISIIRVCEMLFGCDGYRFRTICPKEFPKGQPLIISVSYGVDAHIVVWDGYKLFDPIPKKRRRLEITKKYIEKNLRYIIELRRPS